MSSMLEDINHLSREIGARPAGTEEERLAAMYIAENIQKRSGLPFDIEDFEGAKGKDRVFNFLSIVSAVLMFIAILLSVTTIPAFIISALIAVLLVLEYLDKPFLSNFFRYGISQNVVAKYIPAYSTENKQSQRKRKVVLVCHYDSGRSLPESNTPIFKYRPFIKLITLIVDIIIPLFLLVKMFVFPQTSGALTLFCLILAFIFVLISVLPTLLDFYTTRLLYNEGANCNASSNAALIEIARQLGTGSYSTDEDNSKRTKKPVIHGIDEAKSAGVIPEGANINYEAKLEPKTSVKSNDALEEKEQNLADAKAAIAAFTSPRKPRVQYDDEGNVIKDVATEQKNESEVESKEEISTITIDDASAQRVELQNELTSTMPSYKTESKPAGEVPDWFKSAQSKARKNENESEDKGATQRSRFAYTMDVMAQRQEDELRRKQEEEEEKRAKLREQIEAANKAAEEERKKKFAEKEQPFVEKEEEKAEEKGENKVEEKAAEKPEEKQVDQKTQEFDLDKTQAMPIDESFKLHQQEKANNKVAEEKEEEPKETEDKSQPTMLPEHSGPIELDEMKQYAPLDDQEFISGNEMPENKALHELPEVFISDGSGKANADGNAVGADVNNDDKYSTGELERGKFGTGSFAAVSQSEGTAGATGAFAPVKKELIQDASKSGEIANKEDMFVDDADDSVYNEGEFTDTGAFAGKGYVDMPEEKRKGLFGIFGKKDKTGKHSGKIGEDKDSKEDKLIDDQEDWEGGAFSNLGAKLPFKKNNNDDEEQEVIEQNQDVIEQDYDDETYVDEDAPITSDQNRISSMVDAVPDFEEQIQEFHNSSINMEVWLVALGAEVNENAGTKAFLMEHAQELRGAIIIDVEGLGAGELSLVNSEGLVIKSKTSSRLKRYVRQAANKLNVVVPSVDISWGESSAAYASRHGFKTIKLAGMDGDKPAYYMQKDDLVENIDEHKLAENVKYLLQLIQSI